MNTVIERTWVCTTRKCPYVLERPTAPTCPKHGTEMKAVDLIEQRYRNLRQ